MKSNITITLLAASVLSLAACGGGDGSASDAPPATSVPTTSPSPVVQVGNFIDSAVEGLRYETASQSGVTNKTGDFKFRNGENVTFWLYGTKLNTAAASVILTPADTKNVDLDYTINLLRFLQTVDIDNDPSNGITLPSIDAADAQVVIPLTLDMYEFETNQVVLDFLTKYASDRALVGVEDSVNHFNNSISSYNNTILDLSGATLTARTWSSLCKDPGEGFPNTNFTVSSDGLTYTAKGGYIFGYSETITVDTKLNSVACYQKASSTTGTGKIANITMASHVLFGGLRFPHQTGH